MSRIHCQVTTALAAIVVASFLGCNKAPDFSMVGGGGSVSGDGWWFSSGSTFLQANEPGVLFGMQKTPGGNRDFSYFVIFRHAVRSTAQHTKNEDLSFTGMVASMRDGVTIDGKSFELALELEANKDTGTIRSRTLTMNGKGVDPAKGALFLVDLTSDIVSYEQIIATLPNDLPDPTTDTATVTKLAREVTQKLKRENDSVREFLK